MAWAGLLFPRLAGDGGRVAAARACSALLPPLLSSPFPEILAGIGPRLVPHARAAFARAPPGFSRFSLARRPLAQPNRRHLESGRGRLAAPARATHGGAGFTLGSASVCSSLSLFLFLSKTLHYYYSASKLVASEACVL